MKLLKYFVFLFLLTMSLSSGCSSDGKSGDNEYSGETKNWTLMVYLDGDDSSLEDNAIVDFNELETGLYGLNKKITESFNIIVMMDRYRGGAYGPTESGASDWSDTRLYLVEPDANTEFFNSERLDDGGSELYHTDELGEMNMGAPDTLSYFMEFSKEYFPAENYALILWNHGGGVQKSTGEQITGKAVCWDSDNDNDPLYMDEVQQAVSDNFSAADKLDIIGFDACLMSTVEVAYEFRNLAGYMVGSMSYIQDNGWAYDEILASLTNSSLSAAELSTIMVKTYRDYITGHTATQNSGETISAIDLSQIETLADNIDALGAAVYNENRQSDIQTIRDSTVHFYKDTYDSISYPYIDLYDFCRRLSSDSYSSSSLSEAADSVIDTLSSAVLYAYGDDGNGQSAYYGPGETFPRGLSIFFSRGNVIYDDSSHYCYQWWYTEKDTAIVYSDSSYLYGNLDFCTSNENGDVEGWRELMEAWYDPSNQCTPSTY